MKQLTNSAGEFSRSRKIKEALTQELIKSIIVAMRRTGTTDLDIKASALDLITQFPDKNRNFLVNAIRDGSMGAYGINYKVTSNVLGYWVFQYNAKKKFDPNQQPAN